MASILTEIFNLLQGSYCNQGSVTECAAGFYTNSVGNTNMTDCFPCEAGFLCNSQTPEPCDNGILCLDNNDQTCAAGQTCNGHSEGDVKFGAVLSIPCDIGFYGEDSSKECRGCRAGNYCPDIGMNKNDMESRSCPVAQVCPAGSGLENSLDGCDIGRFTTLQISDKNECNVCPAGYYCDSFKMSTDPTIEPGAQKCAAGFFCGQGSTNPAPFENQCPPGYYCPIEGMKNSAQTTPCPIGTFSNLANSTTSGADACEPCLGQGLAPGILTLETLVHIPKA